LAALDYPRDRCEVLVVDDGSAQPLGAVIADWSSRLPVQLLTQTNAGPAKARNRGAGTAHGRWLAFLDDDCEAAPGWLRGFSEANAASEEALGGATHNGNCDRPYSVTSQILVDHVCVWLRVRRHPLTFFPSNNFAVSREAFHRIGGFSENFTLAAAEDREFCYRWSREGGHLSFVPAAVVKHFHDLTFRSFWNQHFHYGRGAYTFRQILAADEMMGEQRPQPDFYIGLFLCLWRAGWNWSAARNLVLLMLSQLANIAGFLYEWRRGIGRAAWHKSKVAW
jgi:GT2 family glycosyltransferase